MEKSKSLKVITLAGFIMMLSGFVAFKSGAFDKHTDDIEQPDNSGVTAAASDTPPSQITNRLDTPPALRIADSIKFNPAMMPSTKSMMGIEHKIPFQITIDSTKKKTVKK